VSDPDGERRPAPQYGEYATPEEQRARIQHPLPAPEPVRPLPTGPATTVAARPSRTADRIITIVLLVYGLTTVISSVPQLIDFTGFVDTWMALAGIDAEFTNVAAGQLWGAIAAGVFAAGWILTALLSWRSLAARRLSWWIPLVGAIVTFVVVTVCLTVPLMGDPAIASHFGV